MGLGSKRRVQATGVVEALNVAVDGVKGFGSGRKVSSREALLLQAGKERIGDRIVVTVSRSAHTLAQPVFAQDLALR